jgi:ABC-type polysaccharide/polyol phosphate export permease
MGFARTFIIYKCNIFTYLDHVISVFYLTPVFYTKDLLKGRGLGILADANPFSWILQVVRDPFLNSAPAEMMAYVRVGLYVVFLLICAALVTWRCDKRLVYWL